MTQPDWYFKRADYPNFELVSEEFRRNLHIFFPEFNLDAPSNFRPTSNDLVKENMPLLCEAMKFLGLYERWTVTSMIVADPVHGLRPHIDKPGRVFALNWPIYNCENTVTSWYEILNSFSVDDKPVLSLNNNGSRYVDLADQKLQEIDSMILSEPTFIRVDVPHGVKNNGSSVRLAASLRFSPDLYDYF